MIFLISSRYFLQRCFLPPSSALKCSSNFASMTFLERIINYNIQYLQFWHFRSYNFNRSSFSLGETIIINLKQSCVFFFLLLHRLKEMGCKTLSRTTLSSAIQSTHLDSKQPHFFVVVNNQLEKLFPSASLHLLSGGHFEVLFDRVVIVRLFCLQLL